MGITAFIIIAFLNMVKGLPDVIKLAALFDSGPQESVQEAAFHHGLAAVNDDRTLLPRNKLSDIVERLPSGDSFKASKKICDMLEPGVAAIFGPSSPTSANHIQSVADSLHVPHLETRWDYATTRPDYSVNLHPHPAVVGKAYANYVVKMGWKSLVILYENEEGLVRLQEVIKLPKTFTELKISMMQLNQDGSDDYRPMLKGVNKSKENRIIVDIDFDKIELLLAQAKEVGLLTDYFSYLFTSLDIDKVNLSPYIHDSVNITGFRLVDPGKPAALLYEKKFPNLGRGKFHNLFTANALVYDSVHVLANALSDLHSIQDISVPRMSCEDGARWPGGEKLLTFINNVDHVGLTGEIKFDQRGFRTEFTLDLVEKYKNRMQRTGFWKEPTGVNFTQTAAEIDGQMHEKLENKTFRVITVLADPYVMKKEGTADKTKEELKRMLFSELYEGFCIDVIEKLSEVVGFKYEFTMGDGAYGSPVDKANPGGEWNGMIGELRNRKSDLAIVDLTITSVRQTAADFTMPFMNTGVGILYKKRKPPPPNLWSFLEPLSNEVWLYMTTTYLGVSILMFLLARLSPYEWENPHACVDEPEELTNTLTLHNCFWHNWGSLMQQGSDIAPKAVSTRMVAGAWWLFTLIMISSYTANLAAFLTASKMTATINNAEDLSKQTKVKYGTFCCGSTNNFFQGSTIPTYAKLNAFMESAKPSVYTKKPNPNIKGLERVQKEDGGYAFFMEAAAIEYHVERECDLQQLGGLLDSKGYGIALPPGSPYTRQMSDGVLKLQETGVLQQLKIKWWKKERVHSPCESEKTASAQLSLMQLGGVFIVLFGGMLIACVIAVGEFIWKQRKLAVDENESVFAEMWKELKFAMNPMAGDTKPIVKDDSSKSESQDLSKSSKSSTDSINKYGVIIGDDAKSYRSKRESSYAVFNDQYGEKD